MAITFIRPHRHTDARGWFSETYSTRRFEKAGLDIDFVQENQSWSRTAGTLRGLHFQRPPSAQSKLIACLSGRILDCIVDIRVGSPTFGRSLTVELSDAGEQLFVPTGFAHGFITLTPNTLIRYKVSSLYDHAAEAGLAWNDPALALDWRLANTKPVLSERDEEWPTLSRLDSPFKYDGAPMELTEI